MAARKQRDDHCLAAHSGNFQRISLLTRNRTLAREMKIKGISLVWLRENSEIDAESHTRQGNEDKSISLVLFQGQEETETIKHLHSINTSTPSIVERLNQPHSHPPWTRNPPPHFEISPFLTKTPLSKPMQWVATPRPVHSSVPAAALASQHSSISLLPATSASPSAVPPRSSRPSSRSILLRTSRPFRAMRTISLPCSSVSRARTGILLTS